MSLYNKNKLLQMRKKYRANIKKKYGKVEKKFQRCHIFGLREAKYIELCLNIENIKILEFIVTWEENVLFLTNQDHKLFERNKLKPKNLNIIQLELLSVAKKLKKLKYRKNDLKICLEVYESLNKLYFNYHKLRL